MSINIVPGKVMIFRMVLDFAIVCAWLLGVIACRFILCPIFGHRWAVDVKGDMTEIKYCRRCFK